MVTSSTTVASALSNSDKFSQIQEVDVEGLLRRTLDYAEKVRTELFHCCKINRDTCFLLFFLSIIKKFFFFFFFSSSFHIFFSTFFISLSFLSIFRYCFISSNPSLYSQFIVKSPFSISLIICSNSNSWCFFVIPIFALMAVMESPMMVGPPYCHQGFCIIQSFNCNRKYLTPFIELLVWRWRNSAFPCKLWLKILLPILVLHC